MKNGKSDATIGQFKFLKVVKKVLNTHHIHRNATFI